NEERNHNLTVASPKMIVQGQTIHVIWAAGSLPYRYYRFSNDAGQTWSAPEHVFGDLHGQAFDGLAVDRSGRVHFLGQVRYPMGIYHAYKDQTQWSKPALLYLIAEIGSEDDFGDRVHAHNTIPVIRAGNQLVLTFGDPPSDPNRRLFVTYITLDDISPLQSAPTPILTATPIASSTPTPMQPTPMQSPTARSTLLLQTSNAQPVGPVPGPDLAIRVALVPTVLIIAFTMIIQLLKRRR
ncbi:MAG TPA: hypothetical protein VFQ23_01970, partial [Anaerolineales bacterium]|nr:hypothetical protein [Anaerolineales bacterium]